MFPIVFLVLHIASFGIYSKYKKIKDMWDGEDEDSANQIEEKISYAIWAEYIATALGFLYFALMLGGEVFDSFGLWKGISVFLIFVINVVLVTIMQQKCVDLEKEMNPEKEGSVYDTKFSEKWLESCDEAEKMMIYRSAWASYRVMELPMWWHGSLRFWQMNFLIPVYLPAVSLFYYGSFRPVYTVTNQSRFRNR